ncbi:MAG: RsmE family RNA methyltransferase [Planctomycetota bacterium]
MTRRYCLPDLTTQFQADPDQIQLPSAEAGHAIRVMRVQPGDEIELFNGQNHQASAIVTRVTRTECRCRVDPASPPAIINREPTRRLTLAIALPKPDRAREMVTRLTELGVHTVVPLICRHSQRPPSTTQLKKLHLSMVEACKQSGRNQWMCFAEPQSFTDYLDFANRDDTNPDRIIATPNQDALNLSDPASGIIKTEPTALAADPNDDVTRPKSDRAVEPQASAYGSLRNDFLPLQSATSRSHASPASPVHAIVGPEGGLTNEEVDRAVEDGFRRIDLGMRVLRIETAAVVIAARTLLD